MSEVLRELLSEEPTEQEWDEAIAFFLGNGMLAKRSDECVQNRVLGSVYERRRNTKKVMRECCKLVCPWCCVEATPGMASTLSKYEDGSLYHQVGEDERSCPAKRIHAAMEAK